jgi:DNA invertase Pin-like site-specific DNA recombinase
MTGEEDIKKIRKMMEFLVKEKISEKINKLNKDEKKVYEFTGKKVREIVKITGFSAGKISTIWKNLESTGLLIKEGKEYKKVI